MSAAPQTPAEKLRTALDLFETGERLMLQNLRRRFPSASAEELDQKLVEWLRKRPGDDVADAEGPATTLEEWAERRRGGT